jgi:hypothetical protein
MSAAPSIAGGPGRATTVGAIAAVAAAAALAAWAVWANIYRQPIDFRVYYLAAEAWAHGRDPYEMSRATWFAFGHTLRIGRFVWPYRYPPYTAALLRPFLSFGEPAARVAWQSASVASMVAAAWLTARALGGRWMYAAAFLLLLVFAPAYDTLIVGQINGFLVLSLAVALWAIVRRRDRALGVSLAVGTALKLVPAALFVYFLARRRWRASAWFVIGLAVLTLVALPLVGRHAFVGYANWAVDLVRPQLVMNGPMNVTFVGAMGRLFPHDLGLARSLGRLLGGAALLATVVVCWPRRDRPPDDLLAFSMIVTLLALLPPFTWYHQLITLLPPLLVVGQRLWRGGRWWELGLLAVLMAAADGTWILLDPVWWLGFHPPNVYYAISFPTLLCVALWAICGLELWRESRSRRPELSRGT